MPKANCMNQLTAYSNAPPITALTRKITGKGALWKRLSAIVISIAPTP